MSEDYTYETEPTRAHPVQVAALKAANARLAARVQELERELADMRSRQLAQGGKNAERLAGVVLDGERYRQRAETAERENAELRARLDAIGDSREQLADVQHAIWAHWMNYMFTQGTWSDGTWTMPADKSQRWSRQMATPYSALTFKEQESDRHQADKVLAVLMQAVQP